MIYRKVQSIRKPVPQYKSYRLTVTVSEFTWCAWNAPPLHERMMECPDQGCTRPESVAVSVHQRFGCLYGKQVMVVHLIFNCVIWAFGDQNSNSIKSDSFTVLTVLRSRFVGEPSCWNALNSDSVNLMLSPAPQKLRPYGAIQICLLLLLLLLL